MGVGVGRGVLLRAFQESGVRCPIWGFARGVYPRRSRAHWTAGSRFIVNNCNRTSKTLGCLQCNSMKTWWRGTGGGGLGKRILVPDKGLFA